jgi:hypothetical protein
MVQVDGDPRREQLLKALVKYGSRLGIDRSRRRCPASLVKLE